MAQKQSQDIINVPEILMFHTPKTINDELQNIKNILKDRKLPDNLKKRFRRARNSINSALYQAKQNKIKGWS